MGTELETIEGTILSNLIHNEGFIRKVIPYIKQEYFQEQNHKIIFDIIEKHFDKYNTLCTKSVATIALDNKNNLTQDLYDETSDFIDVLFKRHTEQDFDYLLDTTEKWVQDSAFFNALLKATDVIDGEKSNVSKSGIPEEMSKALAITFDNSVGHDLFVDAEDRFDSYQEDVNQIPFKIEIWNKITGGGLRDKTLTILMSSNTGGFKSGTMCSWAADNIRCGKNALYITCEMSEEKIAERIDANLMDIPLDDLSDLGKQQYLKKLDKIKSKYMGNLKVKEYPTSTAHAGHFRFLLKELKEKQNYIPDIIYVDYLNICSSQRLPAAQSANTYTYIKAIAEELRSLAQEFDVPIVSATQGVRQVAGASDVSLSDVSESMGITHTADYFFGVITTEELDETDQIMFKQLKNRYGDVSKNRMFLCNVNKSKMKLYDSTGQPKTAVNDPEITTTIDRKKGFDNFVV